MGTPPIHDVWMRAIYTLVLSCAVVVALAWTRQRQREILRPQDRNAVAFAAFIGAMLGAKLPFLLDNDWSGIADGAVWFADGKTILGGIFGGYLAVEITKWALKIRTSTGDSFAIPVAIAISVGRLGCFLAGCCYGTTTQLPWGVHFPQAQDPTNVTRHPMQLYEFAFHFLWLVILLGLERTSWIQGHRLKFYLMCYLAFRFVSEWIRPETRYWLGLTSYQYASVILFATLAVQWILQPKPHKRFSEPAKS